MVWKPDYVTLADAKAYLRIGDTVDDVQLQVWVTAASRAIDSACNRQFGQLAAATARTYRQPLVYDATIGLWTLDIDDVQDTTGMLVNGVALASSGCVLLPDNAVADGKAYERLAFSYQPTLSTPGSPVSYAITAKYGWAAVPASVVGAVYLQLARWSMRRDAPSGVVGSPDQGSEMRFLAKLDPDVMPMVSTFRRRRRVG